MDSKFELGDFTDVVRLLNTGFVNKIHVRDERSKPANKKIPHGLGNVVSLRAELESRGKRLFIAVAHSTNSDTRRWKCTVRKAQEGGFDIQDKQLADVISV